MMKALLLVLALPLAAFGQEEKQFQLPLFTEGLSTRYSANAIPDEALSEALNVVLDEDVPGVVVARRGRTAYNPTDIGTALPIRGLWQFDASDGIKYFVAFSSQSFYKSTGDGIWTQIPSQLFNDTEWMNCTQALGALWCVNGVENFYWDGISTAAISSMPLGSLITNFRNRIVVSGIGGSRSRVRLSGELDGTDWGTAVYNISTTPANIAVGGVNDGKGVTCLMGVFQDTLLIGKDDSIWGLYGFGNTDFSLRELSRQVGCIDQKSVQEKNNCLYWMSKRGIERFCGTSIERVSDPVRDILDNIITSAGNLRSVTDTSQADFEQGNLLASGAGAPMSSSVFPGSVSPSTWSFTDYDIVGSSRISVDIITNPGYIQLSTGAGFSGGTTNYLSIKLWTDNFSDGDYTTGETTWTLSGGAISIGGDYFAYQPSFPSYGQLYTTKNNGATWGHWDFSYYYDTSSGGGCHPNTYCCAPAGTCAGTDPGLCTGICAGYDFQMADGSNFYSVEIWTGDNTLAKGIYLYKTISGSKSLIAYGSADMAPSVFHVVAVEKDITTGAMKVYVNGQLTMTATDTAISASKMARMTAYSPAVGGNPGLGYSINRMGRFKTYQSNAYSPSGSVTSAIYDTGFSTPISGTFSTLVSSPASTSVSFQVRSASSSYGSWSAWKDILPGQNIGEVGRYWQYYSTFTTAIATSPLTPTHTPVSLDAATTGYFISQCRNPGSKISKWGLFQANQAENGGSVSYSVSTGATCGATTGPTATWNSQTNNSSIALDTASYVAYRVLFDMDVASEAPKLLDATLNWTEGQTRPPTASAVYRDRYYLAYTSSTLQSSVNDNILVLDKNDKWTLFNNHNCYSMALYDRKLYCGSSTTDGLVWLMDYGTSDGAGGYTTKIRTKAFNFGMPEARKSYNKLYLEMPPYGDDLSSTTISVNYILDRGTETFPLRTLNLNEDPAHIPLGDFPFPNEQTTSSRYIQFEMGSSGLDQPWRLFGGKLYYSKLRKE